MALWANNFAHGQLCDFDQRGGHDDAVVTRPLRLMEYIHNFDIVLTRKLLRAKRRKIGARQHWVRRMVSHVEADLMIPRSGDIFFTAAPLFCRESKVQWVGADGRCNCFHGFG